MGFEYPYAEYNAAKNQFKNKTMGNKKAIAFEVNILFPIFVFTIIYNINPAPAHTIMAPLFDTKTPNTYIITASIKDFILFLG